MRVSADGVVATVTVPLTITYSSQRSEVWAQYARLWKQKLWRIHLVLFLLVALGLSFLVSPLLAVAGGLAVCLLFAIYPLAMFKSQERRLRIDDAGIETSIGARHGRVEWHDVSEIADRDGVIVVQRTNGNAFLVPARAFATPVEQRNFLAAARAAWKPLRR